MEISRMDEIRMILEGAAGAAMTLPEIITEEIKDFVKSPQYQTIVEAEQYYRNRSDVQRKENPLKNRSNVKMEHPILRKLVDQKADYLLARKFTVESENTAYSDALNDLFDNTFRRKIKSFGKGAVKSGIAYLAPYYDDTGMLRWMRLPSTEVIPLWTDFEHTELDAYIRFYRQTVYEGKNRREIIRVEFWDKSGVTKFKSDSIGGTLYPDADPATGENKFPHFTRGRKGMNWEAVPLVWAKYNEEELPLCYFIKDLIDDVNWQASVTSDVLRDIAKFIYIIKGYGGQDLGEFIRDLRDSLAVKVDADGGVDKMEPTLNIDAVMAFLDKNRRDLFDCGNGVDTKGPDLGNASGTAINFRYMGLDSDCAALGAELQNAFERMKLFFDVYLQTSGKGDFTGEHFEITFNTDMPVNEADVIANYAASGGGKLSDRTLLANHPWVTSVDDELAEIKKEKEEALAEFGEGLFNASMGSDGTATGNGNGGVMNGEEG